MTINPNPPLIMIILLMTCVRQAGVHLCVALLM